MSGPGRLFSAPPRVAAALGELDPRDPWDEDGDESEADCGRWRNGRLVEACLSAGTEFCQLDCPFNGARS